MSVRVMAWVWEYSYAVGNDRLVLLAIADRANDEGTEAYPSQDALCKKTRLSRRTVQRCIASLEDLGELAVDRTQGQRNTYTLPMPARLPYDLRQSDAGDEADGDPPSVTPRQSGTGVNLTPASELDAPPASLVTHNTSSTSSTHPPRAREARMAKAAIAPAVSPPRAGTPLIGRGESLRFDAAQQKLHAGCHPEVCRSRGRGVRLCMPAALVDEFAAKLLHADPDAAVRDVIAWAQQDAPPAGYVAPGSVFEHWRARWDATRATRPEKPQNGRGDAGSATRSVAGPDATDALLARLTGGAASR